jgi:hypothetical protein
MKRILFSLMTLAVLCACNDNICTISGTLTDPVDTVYLVDMFGEQLDVAAVKDGAFTLKCDIDPETGVSILRGGLPSGEVCYTESGESMGYDPIPLIPDVKKIKLNIADGTPTILGSPLSQENMDFQQWAMNTFFESADKEMALAEAGDTIGAKKAHTEMLIQLADRCREVYQEHKTDAIGVQAMAFLMQIADKDEFIALFEQGGKAVKANAELSDYYEYLKSLPEEVPQGAQIDEEAGNVME